MVTRKNDEAVSPVIGVILMVAITVILAAVIAAFVFGMSGNISKTKVVAITAERPASDKITVMNQGGQDNPSFDYGVMSVTDSTGAAVAPSAWAATGAFNNGTVIATTGANALGSNVGNSLTATLPATSTGKMKVTIVGHFIDNTAQVLLDTSI
jgi:archaeal type IV pilus assembly protein PilA